LSGTQGDYVTDDLRAERYRPEGLRSFSSLRFVCWVMGHAPCAEIISQIPGRYQVWTFRRHPEVYSSSSAASSHTLIEECVFEQATENASRSVRRYISISHFNPPPTTPTISRTPLPSILAERVRFSAGLEVFFVAQ